MAYRHMGASTTKYPRKYPHMARCAYSGNKGIVYSVHKEITEWELQDRLDSEFMSRHCTCERCTEARKHRRKVMKKLENAGMTETLALMQKTTT